MRKKHPPRHQPHHIRIIPEWNEPWGTVFDKSADPKDIARAISELALHHRAEINDLHALTEEMRRARKV